MRCGSWCARRHPVAHRSSAPRFPQRAGLIVVPSADWRQPVVEREVLALFYLQELTLQQIADALDVPQGTVKSRLFRARRLLKERLGAAHTGAQQ